MRWSCLKNNRLLYICLTDTRKPIVRGWKKTICIYETILPTKSQPKLSSMNIIYQPILIEKEYQSSMHILASSWAYWATARGDLKIKGGTWKSYFLPSDNIRATVLHPDHEENEEAIGEADAKQSVDEKAADVFLRMYVYVRKTMWTVKLLTCSYRRTPCGQNPSGWATRWSCQGPVKCQFHIFEYRFSSTPLEEDMRQE